MKVTVYSSPGCFPCRGTKRALTRLEIPFTDIDVADEPAAAEKVKALGYQATPVVVVEYADGRVDHWSGHRPDDLNALAYILADGKGA